jgi:glucose/arabinose dehydrogenase
MNWRCAVNSAALAVLCGGPALAATSPCKGGKPGDAIPAVSVALLAEGFKAPTHIANAGDGSKRLFVVEQAGLIRIVKDGKVLAEPFLDIRERVKYGGEMGLLSVSFHPRFKENGRFFVDYVSKDGGLHTVVAEFRVSKDADRADPASERILFTVPQPYGNHKGGQTAFGPDGFLYVGMGDGGSGNDPHNNAQNPALAGYNGETGAEARRPSSGTSDDHGPPWLGDVLDRRPQIRQRVDRPEPVGAILRAICCNATRRPVRRRRRSSPWACATLGASPSTP